MRTPTDPGADAVARNHLARLCRGFLLARDEDPRRAQAFLLTFLAELRAPSSNARPTVAPTGAIPSPVPSKTLAAPAGIPLEPRDGDGTSASLPRPF